MQQIENVKAKFESIAEQMGFELVELTGLNLGGHTVIRAFIHKPGGVTIDDCRDLSRAYSDYLDLEDPISGKYKLEVSSLGLDRPLKEPADYNRRIGESVKLELEKDSYPKRSVTGKLIETDERGVTLTIENRKERFDYDHIIRGKIVY